jgi:hypothetical protein
MLEAITKFRDTIPINASTSVQPSTDLTNALPQQILPIIPDVTIQYRCGDNIQFSYMYGILPYTAFASRIPSNSKYIYVLSDHPSRAAHALYTSRCEVILQGLFDYLKETNPSSTIVIKRGGDLFLDYVRLAFSKTIICSASTFCFWPALANIKNGGVVHFPLSSLIAGADDINSAPKVFGKNFIWINDTNIISDFRKIKPWQKIVDVLSGKMKLP